MVGRGCVARQDAKPSPGAVGKLAAPGHQPGSFAAGQRRVEQVGVQLAGDHVQRAECARPTQECGRPEILRGRQASGVSEEQPTFRPPDLDLTLEQVIGERLASCLAARPAASIMATVISAVASGRLSLRPRARRRCATSAACTQGKRDGPHKTDEPALGRSNKPGSRSRTTPPPAPTASKAG